MTLEERLRQAIDRRVGDTKADERAWESLHARLGDRSYREAVPPVAHPRQRLVAAVVAFAVFGAAALLVGTAFRVAGRADNTLATSPSYPNPPDSGYWIIFPDSTTPVGDGMQVVARTNLPDGTLYSANTGPSGECCPPVQDGQIVLSMNEVGQLGTSEEIGCETVHTMPSTPALVITITVDSDTGQHVVGVPFGGTPPEQPESVLAILGDRFQNLTGDQVVQTAGGNRLVAAATYPWPVAQCSTGSTAGNLISRAPSTT
jgi:hypothetical protein